MARIDRADFGGLARPARYVAVAERGGLHDCSLHGGLGAGLLGAALVGARGLEARLAENVTCAAHSCRISAKAETVMIGARRRLTLIALMATGLELTACERDPERPPP